MSEAELIDIFDGEMKHVGVADKKTAHAGELFGDADAATAKPPLYHKSFHCWIVSGEGRVVLQRRSDGKRVFKRLFDISAAGHYRAGESGKGGAREIEEELGIKPDISRLDELCVFTDVYTAPGYVNREFCYVYAYLSDIPLGGFTLSGETEGLASADLDGLVKLFDGETDSIDADYLDKKTGAVTRISLGISDFVPSPSGYYAAVLGKLKEWFAGKGYE